MPTIRPCPGFDAETLTFTDCLGREHDLIGEPLHALKTAAGSFGAGRSAWWLREQIKQGNVYPVLITGGGATIEVYDVAIRDWKARQLLAQSGKVAVSGKH
jgi:hypothetical protein